MFNYFYGWVLWSKPCSLILLYTTFFLLLVHKELWSHFSGNCSVLRFLSLLYPASLLHLTPCSCLCWKQQNLGPRKVNFSQNNDTDSEQTVPGTHCIHTRISPGKRDTTISSFSILGPSIMPVLRDNFPSRAVLTQIRTAKKTYSYSADQICCYENLEILLINTSSIFFSL